MNKLDKRKRLQEQDVRRLYPLFGNQDRQGSERMGQEGPSIEEMEQIVHEQLHDQIYTFASVLHQFLEERGDAVPFTKHGPSLPDNVVFPEEMNNPGQDIVEADGLMNFRPQTSPAEVAAVFKKRFGYSLHVADSSVPHPDAGQGLWLTGKASPGKIVAFFPGITYAPIHYREMINYPKIDKDNPYLISRYDGIIVDSKPWGFGLYEEHTFPGTTQTFAEVYQLEGRHPLAFAHFANHPPKGILPNALVAPFDLQTSVTQRPYIPNVRCVGGHALLEPNEVVSGLILVANRDLHEEEIFVNYRLNPHMPRPKWYEPVDEKEDQMRWS